MFKFKVIGVQLVKDARATDRVRVSLVAVAGPGFGSAEPNSAPPDGSITMTITTEAAQKFQLGDVFPVIFRGEGEES